MRTFEVSSAWRRGEVNPRGKLVGDQSRPQPPRLHLVGLQGLCARSCLRNADVRREFRLAQRRGKLTRQARGRPIASAAPTSSPRGLAGPLRQGLPAERGSSKGTPPGVGKLRAANAGGIQRFQNCPVTHAQRGLHAGLGGGTILKFCQKQRNPLSDLSE